MILLNSVYLDFRAKENIKQDGTLYAIIEFIIAVIINAIWIKQPFWKDIFFPLLLVTLPLIWTLSQILDGVLKNFPWLTIDLGLDTKSRRGMGRVRPYARYQGFWDEMSPIRFGETLWLCLITIFISSISFALSRLNLDALFSALSQNIQSDKILYINSIIFISSLVGLIMMKVFAYAKNVVKKSRRKY